MLQLVLGCYLMFVCNNAATTEIYTYLHTLSLHDALPISAFLSFAITWFVASALLDQIGMKRCLAGAGLCFILGPLMIVTAGHVRSEEHTSELQSLMRS